MVQARSDEEEEERRTAERQDRGAGSLPEQAIADGASMLREQEWARAVVRCTEAIAAAPYHPQTSFSPGQSASR